MPALGLALTAVAAAAIGFLSEGSGGETARQAVPQPATVAAVRGVVEQVSGDRLTLTTRERGPVTYRLTPSTVYEVQTRATAGDIRIGRDWLNVGTVRHPQTLFVVSGLVVIPEGGPR